METMSETGVRHMALAASATEQICGLPAVATQQWCDQAAASLLSIREGVIVTVTIGAIDASGSFRHVEASGVAGAGATAAWREQMRDRHRAAPDTGWRFGDPASWRTPRAAMLGDAEAALWRDSAAARAWADLGVVDMIAGAAPLSAEAPSRVIFAEIGAMTVGGFTPAHVALVQAVMRPLANRALRAFGNSPQAAGRVLTAREQQVLERLTLGKSVKQIAAELSRSPHTVHDHVKSLHRKLNASSRGELIARALGHLENGRRISRNGSAHNSRI